MPTVMIIIFYFFIFYKIVILFLLKRKAGMQCRGCFANATRNEWLKLSLRSRIEIYLIKGTTLSSVVKQLESRQVP